MQEISQLVFHFFPININLSIQIRRQSETTRLRQSSVLFVAVSRLRPTRRALEALVGKERIACWLGGMEWDGKVQCNPMAIKIE